MSNVTKKNSAAILKKYLAEHGIKQIYLAKKMNMKPSTLSAYLHGTTKFSADFAFNVAKALKIDPNIFIEKSYKK